MFFISVQENKLVKKITPRLLKKFNKNLARALFTFVRKEHASFETCSRLAIFLILYRKNDK